MAFTKTEYLPGDTLTADFINELQDAILESNTVPAEIFDFARWTEGTFYIGMSDGTTKQGSVEFDAEGRPTSVTLNGHTLTVTFPVEAEDDDGDSGETRQSIPKATICLKDWEIVDMIASAKNLALFPSSKN